MPVLYPYSSLLSFGSALLAATGLPQIRAETMAAVFFAMMPIGGLSHGYKGYALTIMSEVLSMALGGYGCAGEAAETDGEANSVFIQMIDPAAFGSQQAFTKQVQAIQAICENSRHQQSGKDVRIPGQRAWIRRREQLEYGVELYPSIIEDLKPWANSTSNKCSLS